MSTTTLAVVNGVLPTIQDVVDEEAEFEKILKLRDEIFAGNHPRLTVPARLLRKFSPSPASSSPSSLHVQAQPQQPSSISVQVPPGLGLSLDESQPATSTASHSTPTASGINPVLLTKSDDLVRAEAVFHRNRLEKQLRDQFEQKRLDFRKKPAPAEAKPDFDISSLLAKALESVKPVSLEKEQSDKDGDNDSVDENSFYSSRAPDSTPERGEGSASSQEDAVEEPVADETGVVLPHANAIEAQKDTASKASTTVNPFVSTRDKMDIDNDDEEGEYSPPDADQYPAQNVNGSHVSADPRTRQVRRYSDLDQNGKRPASPPEPNMRIVRNHITSPVAPQPSRVSPLTFTKDSLVLQGRQYTNGRPRGRAESPSQSPENVSARNKRRKVDKKAEKRAQRRGIKQENVSPPPFHDIQPLGAKPTQPEDRTIVIDEPPPPPQEIRYAQAPRYVESPQRPLSRQAEPIQMASPRVLSRNAMRPREEPDLRRVASMHNMRLEQPREYVEYTPARQRATSYIRVDSPMRELPRDYTSDNDRPLQEVRVMRTPAPEYREVYQPEPEIRYIPEPMPPPPRERIVVDQYGRRFREIIQERPSVAPRASSYLPHEAPQYYDEYPAARAGSIMIDERAAAPRHAQEIPPPRVMRQTAENSVQPMMSVSREMYEPVPGGRAASIAVYERPQRQVVYADAPDDFRTPVRMSSVRPPTAQYDEQPVMSMAPRAASVRPGVPQPRQGSVFVDDRAPVRREYLPVEQTQPRYRVVDTDPHAPMQRYVDAQGREMIPAQHDDGVRYVQRY